MTTSNVYPGIRILSSNRNSSTTVQKCEICGRKKSLQMRMWYFPENEDICRQWLKYVGNEDLVYIPIEKLQILKQVCDDHFLPEDYCDNKNDLKKSAIPMVGLTRASLSDELFSEFPFHLANYEATQKHGGDAAVKVTEKSKNVACSTSTTLKPNISTNFYKKNLHQDLIQSWSNILCQGLPLDDKLKILGRYKIPNNCMLLAAPHFNPRITNILPKSTKIRDGVMWNNQQQLSLGIVAIGRVLSSFLSVNNQEDREAKEILTDACQILTDLHCMMSQHRLSMLTGDESFTISVDGMDKTAL